MDRAEDLVAEVAESRRHGRTLSIVGHGSKAALGAPAGDARLCTTDHVGILDYRPQELVVTARAGTPLDELADVVASEGQLLPFDPPRFAGKGTLGGAIASGLSGPARPWRGSVRDALLGVEIVNGLGERLRFGGSVMKNVAGYDVSRLMAGARGTLGLMLSASVRLLPRPAVEETFARRCAADEAFELCRDWLRRPLPISATCHAGGVLHVRLAGSGGEVASARAAMDLPEPGDDGLWDSVRDHSHGFFDEAPALTRVSLPRGAAYPAAVGDRALVEWGGCQAWWRSAPGGDALPPGALVRSFSGAVAVHATDATAKYAARLKTAFDPDGLFNPGLPV